MDRSRLEYAAEHCWHLAVMALLLAEHVSNPGMDLLRVLKMVLLHDLVEIDAGDTYCYDDEMTEDQKRREKKAAQRIFNILPHDQAEEFRALWDEFEVRNTKESRFAAALDRLQPLIHSYLTEGVEWRRNKVKKSQVFSRIQPIEEASPVLWNYAIRLMNEAVKKGMLPP